MFIQTDKYFTAEQNLLLSTQLKKLYFAAIYTNKKFRKYRVATGKKAADLRKVWLELVSKEGLKIISEVMRVNQLEGMLSCVYAPLTSEACTVNTEVYFCLEKAPCTKQITFNISQSAHMQVKIKDLKSVLFN
jgi:hypothetical protein